MTYFSLDPYDTATFVPTLRQIFNRNDDAPTLSRPMHQFALVDSAFDYGKQQIKWKNESISLYSGVEHLSNLSSVSPQILQLSAPNTNEFEREIHRLAHHCDSRPMLSFLQSTVDAEELVNQWGKIFTVMTEDDNSPFLLRLADTRVLPALSTMSTLTLWKNLTQSVQEWLIVDRNGTLTALSCLPSSPPNFVNGAKGNEHEVDSLVITNQDLTHLLQMAEPDSVINMLAEHFPDLMPTSNHAHFYTQIAQVCALAKQYHIDAFPDVLAIATASVLTQGAICNDSKFIAMLQTHQWPSGQLNTVLQAFID